MRPFDADWITASKADGREWTLLVKEPGEILTPDTPVVGDDPIPGTQTLRIEDMLHCVFEDNMEPASGMGRGRVGVSEMRLTAAVSATTDWEIGDTLEAYLGLYYDGAVNYELYGTYKVADIQPTGNDFSRMYVCYDAAGFLTDAYEPTVTMPNNNWAAVRDDVMDQAGLSFSGTAPSLASASFTAVKGSLREWLGWLCGLMGRNCRIEPDGTVTFVANSATVSDTIAYEHLFNGSPTFYTDDAISYTKLTSGTDVNRISYGTGKELMWDNPFITAGKLAVYQPQIAAISFRPCSFKYTGYPHLQVGDIVEVVDEPEYDEDGNEIPGELLPTFDAVIMHQTVTFDGGLSAVIDCYGAADAVQKLNESPMHRAFMNALEQAGAKITGNVGGNIVIRDKDGDGYPDELLILNTSSISTATSAWRWNHAGLGFATGAAGQLDDWTNWKVAITNDGMVNAEVIQSVSTSGNAECVLHLDSGEILMTDSRDDSTTFRVYHDWDTDTNLIELHGAVGSGDSVSVKTEASSTGSKITVEQYIGLGGSKADYRSHSSNFYTADDAISPEVLRASLNAYTGLSLYDANENLKIHLDPTGASDAPLPVNQGGTGGSTRTAALASLFGALPTIQPIGDPSLVRAGWTGGYYQWGKLVYVNATAETTASLAANNDQQVGIVPKPLALTALSVAFVGANRTVLPASATIRTNGAIYIDHATAIPSGTTFTVTGFYMAQ